MKQLSYILTAVTMFLLRVFKWTIK